MKALTVLFLIGTFAAFGQGLTITPINDSVYIATTQRTLDTGPFPANCMYVVTKAGVILIDTPWDTTQILPLLDSIQVKHNQPVVFCLATHFHDDRTGGFNLLNELGIPTYSTALTKTYCIREHEPLATHTFVNDTTFDIGSVEFETYFPGAGHAPDNIVVWFPRWEILYGGCFVKSTDSPTLGFTGDADLVSWKAGILKVKKRYKQPSYIIPGHQGWMSEWSLNHTLKLLEDSSVPHKK